MRCPQSFSSPRVLSQAKQVKELKRALFTSTTVELVLTSKIKNRTWTYSQWTCVCGVHNDMTDGKSRIFIRNNWIRSSKSFPNAMILQSLWLSQLPCLAHSSLPLTRNKACTAKHRALITAKMIQWPVNSCPFGRHSGTSLTWFEEKTANAEAHTRILGS